MSKDVKELDLEISKLKNTIFFLTIQKQKMQLGKKRPNIFPISLTCSNMKNQKKI